MKSTPQLNDLHLSIPSTGQKHSIMSSSARTSFGKAYSVALAAERRDGGSTVSSLMSKSAASEPPRREFLGDDETRLFMHLTRSRDGKPHRNHMRKSRNASQRRRKRGSSLEREICQLIMGTAAMRGISAHLECDANRTEAPGSSVDFILKDLALNTLADGDPISSSVTKSQSSGSKETVATGMFSFSETKKGNEVPRHISSSGSTGRPIIEAECDTDQWHRINPIGKTMLQAHAEVTEYDDPGFDLPLQDESVAEAEASFTEKIDPILPSACSPVTETDFEPIDSFESLSWKPTQSSLSPLQDTSYRSRMKVLQEMKDRSQSFQQVDQESPDLETGVILKSNSDEWTPFEDIGFFKSSPNGYSSYFSKRRSTHGKEYNVTEGVVPGLPDHAFRNPSPSRQTLNEMDPSYNMEDNWHHHHNQPHSPDSVFYYPNSAVSQKGSRVWYRLDPPSAQELELPQDEMEV